MPIAAVLFDVDGTLVDSVDAHARAWREALHRFGRDVSLAAVRAQIGKGGDQLVAAFLSPEEVERDGERLRAVRDEIFTRAHLPGVRPLRGARDLVLRVKQEGKRALLATSARREELDHLLGLLRLAGEVEATSADDVARSKPYPDLFEVALRKSGAAPNEALAVGDSPWDALAAKRAGIATVGLLSGGFAEAALREAGCVAIYDGPAALLAGFEGSPLAG